MLIISWKHSSQSDNFNVIQNGLNNQYIHFKLWLRFYLTRCLDPMTQSRERERERKKHQSRLIFYSYDWSIACSNWTRREVKNTHTQFEQNWKSGNWMSLSQKQCMHKKNMFSSFDPTQEREREKKTMKREKRSRESTVK